MENNKEIKILDIKINALLKAEVLDLITKLLADPSSIQQQLVTTNPEFIMCAQTDEEFKNIINNSWLSVADGYGIRLAAKYLKMISDFGFRISDFKKFLLGIKIFCWGITRNNQKLNIVPETITGTDLIPEIVRLMSYDSGITNKKIFLLGGYGETPRLTAEQLKKTFPTGANNYSPLQIAYTTFESKNIIETINSFQPLVLFVALNHPRAQKWINANLPKILSVKLAIGVGGAFDYLSGKIKRAPQNLRGFEWFYRLITQPRRFKRIYTAVVKFPWFVFKKSIY
ncbi:MAG TPA: WecB/TagA/CpsF family glycosyltransferase [bacterium]|nr:WecB/TagA/CpsF family glycosyltransferase [bacterium]